MKRLTNDVDKNKEIIEKYIGPPPKDRPSKLNLAKI